MDTSSFKYVLKILLIRKFKQMRACKISIYKFIIVLLTNTKQQTCHCFWESKKQQKNHQNAKGRAKNNCVETHLWNQTSAKKIT